MNTAPFRSRTALVAGAIIATLFAVGLASPASAAPLPAKPDRNTVNYVALGDSYSSGLGLPKTTGPAGCARSSDNYPNRLAKALKLSLTDVSCDGAAADNIWSTPETLPDGTTVPVQTSALSADTDVVTITVGGNGLKFTDIASACAAASPSGPLLQPALASFPNCQAYFAYTHTNFTNVVNFSLVPALRATYSAIRAAAPHAQVFVLGFPTITPTGSEPTCFTPITTSDSYPFTTTDTAFLHGVETLFDNAISTEAARAGFTYVPTFEATASTDLCAKHPSVNGVNATSTPAGGFSIDPASLHLTKKGMDLFADTARPLLAAALTQ